MEHDVVDGKDMPKDQYEYNYVYGSIGNYSGIAAILPGKKPDTAANMAAHYYRYLYGTLCAPAVWIKYNAGPFVSRFLAKLEDVSTRTSIRTTKARTYRH